MYKIDIKEALYPIQIVLVVYKKLSKTSVFIDRNWPIKPVLPHVCEYYLNASLTICFLSNRLRQIFSAILRNAENK